MLIIVFLSSHYVEKGTNNDIERCLYWHEIVPLLTDAEIYS